MTKQEQIEEMAKDIVRIAGLDVYGKAEELVNLCYRKLPEDSVVLSREEYKRLLDNITEQEKEIDALKEKCEELRNEKWDAQDDLDCYYDEMLNKIKQAKIKAVKEFAEKLKARITKFIWRHNIPECIFNDIMSDLLKEYEK